MTMYNKYFDQKASFFFAVEKPSPSMGDVKLRGDMKFKFCSQYNQIFVKFLKPETSNFCWIFFSNPLGFFAKKFYLYVRSQQDKQTNVSLKSLKSSYKLKYIKHLGNARKNVNFLSFILPLLDFFMYFKFIR